MMLAHRTTTSQPTTNAIMAFVWFNTGSAGRESDAAMTKMAGGIATVALVEDDVDLAEMLCELLEAAHYTVVRLPHGGAALAYLRACATLPDVIMLDLNMPIMNGWTFRQSQRRDPRLQQIPVIVCSATPEAHHISAVGADAVLQKPFDLDDVLTVVERLALR
jgi:twitching motility two-component system response regulator PilH